MSNLFINIHTLKSVKHTYKHFFLVYNIFICVFKSFSSAAFLQIQFSKISYCQAVSWSISFIFCLVHLSRLNKRNPSLPDIFYRESLSRKIPHQTSALCRIVASFSASPKTHTRSLLKDGKEAQPLSRILFQQS